MLLSTYGTIEFDLNCDTNHYYRIEEFANNCGRVQNVHILSEIRLGSFMGTSLKLTGFILSGFHLYLIRDKMYLDFT